MRRPVAIVGAPSDECLVDLVEVARIKTLDDLGEGHDAFDRTRRWLATKRSVPTTNSSPAAS